MERSKSLLFFGFPAAILALSASLGAIDILLSGSWSEVIDVADLQGAAGSDLNPSYESAANQILLGIAKARNKSWEVDVSMIDTIWDASLGLSVKRTSSGTGRGTVSGGLAYLQIGSVPQAFVTGRDELQNINLRMRLSGVSVAVSPQTYATTVVYTVIEIK